MIHYNHNNQRNFRVKKNLSKIQHILFFPETLFLGLKQTWVSESSQLQESWILSTSYKVRESLVIHPHTTILQLPAPLLQES